jgi:hypothetical protein
MWVGNLCEWLAENGHEETRRTAKTETSPFRVALAQLNACQKSDFRHRCKACGAPNMVMDLGHAVEFRKRVRTAQPLREAIEQVRHGIKAIGTLEPRVTKLAHFAPAFAGISEVLSSLEARLPASARLSKDRWLVERGASAALLRDADFTWSELAEILDDGQRGATHVRAARVKQAAMRARARWKEHLRAALVRAPGYA